MDSERRLLLVDDEANILSSLARLFRREGYQILRANCGTEGLNVLAQEKVGVIISDQRMPEMTGVEFLSKVKDLYPETIRMVLSGYTDLKSVTDAINEGSIYKFLTKPWDDDLLRSNVKEAFERYELEQLNTRLTRDLQSANAELAKLNAALEQRVEIKTHEGSVNLRALQVAQEVFEHIPAAVLGISDDGIIVIANHVARQWLDHDDSGIVGCFATEILPEAVAQVIQQQETHNGSVPEVCRTDAGVIQDLYYSRMAHKNGPQGWILMLILNSKSKESY